MTLTVLILAVCRTPVAHELSEMTLFSMSSRSSVDRVPTRCSGGYGFDSFWGLRARAMLLSSLFTMNIVSINFSFKSVFFLYSIALFLSYSATVNPALGITA